MRQEPAALQLAETISVNIVHHRPTPPEKKIAASVVHFGIATGMGALYGGLAEMDRRVAAGFGTGFGAALWLGANEIGLPALGVSPSPVSTPLSEQACSLASHLLYGAILEAVRQALRKR